MEYKGSQFNEELRQRIEETEIALQRIIYALLSEYRPLLSLDGVELEGGFGREGEDVFAPPYRSEVAIALFDWDGEMFFFHTIPIWQCERLLWGMPLLKHIIGSRIVGEFVDETVEEMEEELRQLLQEQAEACRGKLY